MDENGSIESLTLEINARSESAEKAVDKLISTLERLQNRTANLGLGNIGTQLNGIRRAAAGFGDKEAAGLERILGALDKLQNVSTIKISSSIANQLVNIGNAANLIADTDFSGIERMSAAMSSLSSIGKVSIGSTLTQLGRIPEIAKALKEIDMGEFAAEIREVADALKPLADEMEKVSRGFSAFPEKLQRVIKETDKLEVANKKAENSYKNLLKTVGVFAIGAKAVLRAAMNLVDKQNEYIESQNLFNVAMGQYAGEAREYANAVSDALGIDPAEWMKNQGVFMTLATGFGIAGDGASEMSKNLTQLSYDLASFYNISSEEAFQKVQSGLAGEIEPMRRLGYDLSNAKLEQIALSQGIKKSVNDMTQAEKAGLRYYAMMTQVTQVQGDMARTIDHPANQLRVLRAKVEEASRALGNLLLPIVKKVVPWLIAGAESVTKFANGLAMLLGIEGADEGNQFDYIIQGAQDQENAWAGATDAAAEYKRMLLGIDELNVLNGGSGSDSGSSGGGYGSGYGGGGTGIPGYDSEDVFGSVLPDVEEPDLSFVDKLLLSIKDVFFDWENFNPETLGQKLITGLGAALGAATGFKLLGLKGGLLGLVIGTALSLALNSMIFDHDGKLSGSEMMSSLSAALAALAGGYLGFRVGGVTGAGLGIMAGVGLWLLAKSLEWNAEGIGFTDMSSGIMDLLLSLSGGIIGFVVGGPHGAAIGATIGLGLSMIAKTMDWSMLGLSSDEVLRGIVSMCSAAAGGAIGFALGGPGGAAIGAAIGFGISFLVNSVEWENVGAKMDGLIQGAKTSFDGFFAWLGEKYNQNKELALQGSIDSFNATNDYYMIPTQQDFTNLFAWLSEKYTQNKDALIQAQVDAFTGQNEQYMIPTQEDFANLFSWMRENYVQLKSNIIESFNTAKANVMSNFITPIRNQTVSLASSMRSQFQSVGNSIANAFQSARSRAQAAFSGLASWFSSNVVTPIQNLLSRISGAISSAISSASSALGSLFGGSSSKKSYSNPYDNRPDWIKAQGLTFGVFASGGFPDVGQLFVAREQGPELVGRIGNQSAVANNNQIIDGIRQGVYEAMMASNSGGRNGDINLIVSGKQLMTAVAEEARRETVRTGVNPLTQGG